MPLGLLRAPISSELLVGAAVAESPKPELPTALPKKNTSPTATGVPTPGPSGSTVFDPAAKPVCAVARTPSRSTSACGEVERCRWPATRKTWEKAT